MLLLLLLLLLSFCCCPCCCCPCLLPVVPACCLLSLSLPAACCPCLLPAVPACCLLSFFCCLPGCCLLFSRPACLLLPFFLRCLLRRKMSTITPTSEVDGNSPSAPPPEPSTPRNVSDFAVLRSCPRPCQLPQKVLRFLRPSSPSLTRQHHKSCATLFTSEFRVTEFLPAASLLEGCSVCGGALPSWTTVCTDWADQRGVQGQLCPVEQRQAISPLQGDDCPPERLEEGQDPAHANWWRPWHQPLDTLGLHNSRACSLDVRAPLKSHKPGDGHEGQVAGHTSRKRTTGSEDTKAGATEHTEALCIEPRRARHRGTEERDSRHQTTLGSH